MTLPQARVTKAGMSDNLKRSPRVFIAGTLSEGARLSCDKAQAHYLLNVMRLRGGSVVRAFNGTDGEWTCQLAETAKKACELTAVSQSRPQTPLPDIHYLFAPLKHARLDYMVQKATELGCSQIQPVITAHTNATRVKLERMRANAIEAAEQCNLLGVPEIGEPVPLETLLSGWEPQRQLIFCDEDAASSSPLNALTGLGGGPLAVLIGPEGGFSPDERAQLLELSFVTAISLGPRVMRADTAGVAAMALVQAVLGDWR